MRLGRMEAKEFDDEEIEAISNKIKTKPEFSMFDRIDRSGKHLICRINDNPEAVKRQGTNFYYYAQDRTNYKAGDLRVSYYVARVPDAVHFLAQ